MVAIAAAAPASPPSPGRPVKPESHKPEEHEKPIAIISQETEMEPGGYFKNAYETENGIKVSEEGSPDGSIIGFFTYTDPEGNVIETTYTADKEGFHVEGAHLPVPPPIPADIQKGLDYNAAHPEEDNLEEEEEEKELPKKKF